VERFSLIIVALLGILLTACASDPARGGLNIRPVRMPDWTYNGQHPEFPESDYIVAYGLARNAREAAEIAEQRLEILICDFAVRSHETLFKDTQFAQIVTEQAAWFRIDEFTTAVRSDAASNGFEAVAVRAIQRNELGLRARALLPTAQKELADVPQPPTGLGSIGKRMEMWGEYFLLAVRVVALELLASDTLNRTAFDKLETALMALWELPALVRTDQTGGDQHLRINGGLAEPLVLRASFRGKPVGDVPLAWGPGAGFRGVVEGDRETDANGRATARVHQFAATGDDFGYVRAGLDLDRLIGRRLGIAMNVWLWRVRLPSRSNGQLVVTVKETEKGDSPLPDPLFTPEIKKWADGRNLAVTTGEPDREKYAYHLVLEGEVDVTTFTSDGLPGAYVSGSFTLTDRETGTVLYSYALGIRRSGQAGNTEASVKLLAMRDGAAEVMAEFASRIIVTLPAPGDEFGRAG
jgi:hypothetical protein